MIDASKYPNCSAIIGALLHVWPDHERFLRHSFAGRDDALMVFAEKRASDIVRIAQTSDLLSKFCEDYKFLCGKVLDEEYFFRHHDRYRLSTFAEAMEQVYSDRVFMDRYMNFLLLTHVLWDNHCRALRFFEVRYLPLLPQHALHLEIGPGHGLLLYLASQSPQISSLTGWDVSHTSIGQTERCLGVLAPRRSVSLVLQDLFEAPRDDNRRFDSVVMAEVLEHLEDPGAALQSVRRHMRQNGLIWIHVPINSPAPDHIHLLRTPEEAIDLVEKGGFQVVDHEFFPMSGATLERARKRKLTISAVITARNAG